MKINLRSSVVFLALILCLLPMSSSAESVFAFEAPSYDVYVGKTIKAKPVAQGIEGKLTYVWSSSDESIATVKDGTIKGISAGQAVINCTGTIKDGASYTASFIANVLIQMTKIKSDKSEITLAPRDSWSKKTSEYSTFTPVVTIEPDNASNKQLEWSSSKEGVAGVSEDGVITARSSAGTATITGKAKDGSGKTVKIKVTVPKCFVTEKSITIKEETGAQFGYVYASVGGISVYSTKVKGDAFSIDEEQDDDQGIKIVTIKPKKAGTGSISFVRNGSTLATVNVKVEKSSVRDKSTYPAMDVLKILADKDANAGAKVHQVGVIAGVDGDTIFAYVDGEARQYFAFMNLDKKSFEPGDQYLVYGVIEDYVPYTTDTGLTYDCPRLTNVSFEKASK